jgi:8-oxo-dGTP diphosphatase
MPYCPIAGTLGYVLSPDRARVLMVHRVGRSGDDQFGKYNGLGGKLERGENVADGMRRELWEEAGIEVERLELRGTINWTNFGPKGEDWLGFVFLVTAFAGEARTANEEGPLSWVPLAELATLPMWEGDRHFLPLVFDSDPRPFHAYMPYDRERCLDWVCTRL